MSLDTTYNNKLQFVAEVYMSVRTNRKESAVLFKESVSLKRELRYLVSLLKADASQPTEPWKEKLFKKIQKHYTNAKKRKKKDTPE